MNIVLVSQEFPPETAKGGIGSQNFAKARGMVERGHQVSVVSHSSSGRREESSRHGVHVIRIPGMLDGVAEQTEAVQWMSRSMAVARELTDRSLNAQIDLIEFPDWGAEGYVYLLNRTDWNHIPCVIHLHGPLIMFAHTMGWPDLDSEFYRTGTHMEATAIRLADHVYSSSACSAGWVDQYYRPGCKDVPVIHTGVDTDIFTPGKNQPDAEPVILFVGSLVANKGIFELVESACRVAKDIPGLRLRVVGGGDALIRERLLKKAADGGAPDLLEMPGYLSRDQLPGEFSRAHVFVSPAYYEGGPGFVFLEAMACGLPVIGCSGSGIEEVVAPGETGYLVPPRDIAALAESIGSLFNDPEGASRMGHQARSMVAAKFNTRLCLDRLEEYYLTVLEQSKGKAKVK